MTDYIPVSCQKAMKTDNQRFVTTKLSEVDDSSVALEFDKLHGDSSNGRYGKTYSEPYEL